MRRILVGALAAVAVFASQGSFAGSVHHSKLAPYCAEVRTQFSKVVDPTHLSAEETFESAVPTEVLGQKIQRASRRIGLQGTLLLGLVISTGGRPLDVRVLESSGYPKLDLEAVDLFNSAAFSPARLDGESVATCAVLRVTFKYV